MSDDLTPQARVAVEGHYYDDGLTPRESADALGLDVSDVVAFLQRDTAIAIDADLPDVAFETGEDETPGSPAEIEAGELDMADVFGPGGPRERKSWRPYAPESR